MRVKAIDPAARTITFAVSTPQGIGSKYTPLVNGTRAGDGQENWFALNLLEEIANASHRAVAVLGDMLELGAYEEEGHRLVGGRAARVAAKLVTVGSRARWIAEEALADGMKSTDVHPVTGNNDAIAVLLGLLRAGDIILVKGSRGLAMEAIVDVLAETAEGKR